MKATIRNLTQKLFPGNFLFKLACGKNDHHLFVKILPRHFQYSDSDIQTVTRQGICYQLNLNNYNDWLLYFGIDNQNKQNIYKKIQNGFVVFDVGSNIGEVLFNMAKVNPDGKIYGFEPVQSTFEKLSKNVSLNPFQNISIKRLALSDKNEIVYYQSKQGHSGGTMMSKSPSADSDFIEAIKLDDFVQNNAIQQIDFIKVDIEGFEMNFLMGAIESIQKFKPLLFMEIDHYKLKRQNTSAIEILNQLKSMGYLVFHAEKGEEIAENHLSEKHFDIFCVPS